MNGWFDRKKRIVMEKSLKEWGRYPGLLVDLVLSKRLQMHQNEAPEEVVDIVHQPIFFAPMVVFILDDAPYMVFPGFQCWFMAVVYAPMPAFAPFDLDVRVFSQI